MRTKTVQLSQINQHIKDMQAEIASIKPKVRRLVEQLAEVGIGVARIGFQNAMHDGGNDVVVAETGEWINNYTMVVRASGSMIAFIEFGSGVYYNGAVGSSLHPKGVEMGMLIGEYGKGKGKQFTWGFVDGDGNVVITHGNPPAMAMWDASQQMREQITTIARSVFMQ